MTKWCPGKPFGAPAQCLQGKAFHEKAEDDREGWIVHDDLADSPAVLAAELNAIEAFLTPLLHAIMRPEPDTCSTARGEQKPALTQKRRKAGGRLAVS